MADRQLRIHGGDDNTPWFWKIFGGAIIGLISILLLAHLTNINSNVDRTFLGLRDDIKEVRQLAENQRDRITALEQGGYREKVEAMQRSVILMQASLDELKQRLASNDASLNAVKDEMKAMHDWTKDFSKQLQETREKLVAETAAKAKTPAK